MKYASEAIYRITAWLTPEMAREMESEYELEAFREARVNGVGCVEVVFETTDGGERDRACAWLEARR